MATAVRVMAMAKRVAGKQQQQGQWRQGWRVNDCDKGSGNGNGNGDGNNVGNGNDNEAGG